MLAPLRSKVAIRGLNQKFIAFGHHVPLQKIQFRCYPTVKHLSIRWLRPKEKIPKVNPKHFPLEGPVSGSFNPNEDLAEEYNKPYKLDVSQLTKNGYLRYQKPYEPPEDAKQQLLLIVKSMNPKLKNADAREIAEFKLDDIKFKFNFLSRAIEKLDYRVPTSLLHLMESVGDVIQFYQTPIQTETPYEELHKREDLPPNLHIQKEPIRFHPETDTAFGGITAFPKTTTIVSGIRAKQKFKGQQFKIPWPHA